MTAQIIPFSGYAPNTRLNIGFIAGLGLSVAIWAWIIAGIVCIAVSG